MSAEAILDRLARLGITLSLEGEDRLAIEGPDDQVEAEIETIRLAKPLLIAYLQAKARAERTELDERASRIRSTAPLPEARRVTAVPPVTPRVEAPVRTPKPKRRATGPTFLQRTATTMGDWRRSSLARLEGISRTAGTAVAISAGKARRFTASAQDKLKTAAADAPPPVIAAAVPFQSDLSEIIEEPPPPHMRRTSQILAAFVVIGLVVSAVAEIDVVVRGTGKLTVDGPPLVLQPIERAILKTLVVKPGEVVHKGQVLATLDPTFAEADVSAIDSQQRMLSAQLRRVEAEAKDVPNYADTRTPEDALQSDIFRQRRQELALRLRAFDEEIKRGEAGLRTLDVERTLLEQQLSVAKDVEQMRSTLLASQSGSRLQFLESRSVRIRAEKDHQGATDRLVELRHDLDAKRAERQAFIEEWRRRLYEETDRLRTELARIEGAQSKARKYRDLIQIRAPEDGVVIDIARRSVGSVLREAETLITLAPSDMPLIAEVALASADVGYAKPGDTVIVKIDTFPYMRHGTLKGTLRAISQDSFAPGSPTDGTGGTPAPATAAGSFHKAQIVLTSTELNRLPEGARLTPGMTLSADIRVGTRTIISYFLSPIVRGFDESLREP